MPLLAGKQNIGRNIETEQAAGKKHEQAVAIALDVARRHRDTGGEVSSQKFHVGPIHSHVAGRTDHLPITVPSGSYVLPADIVSAGGEGNTMAGFKVLRRTFGGQPYGGSEHPYGQKGGPYGYQIQRATGGKVERHKLSTLDQIHDAIKDDKKSFYVRWSRDPKHDLKKGARSRDYVTGQVHEGLSARDITPDMPPHRLARALTEYASPGLWPHIYSGKQVGTDSDGYPSISDLDHVGSLSPQLVTSLRTGLPRWLELRHAAQNAQNRLQTITDPFARQIAETTAENSKQELAKMPDFSDQVTSGPIAKASGGAVRAAGILFLSPEREVLLLKRAGKDHHGEWGLPAGHIEKGERPEEAARRETREEAGYDHDGGLSPFMHSDKHGTDFVTFLAHSSRFKPKLNDEHDEARWVTPEEAQRMELHPGVREALNKLRARKAGGGAASGVPIVAAGGEHVLSPDEVRYAGAGDLDMGHRVLDSFVREVRKELIRTLKGLPGPRRD